eukprot:gb/GEZN01001066.1/.p1 GENE.gb/GEZN01001066.1/~~gb/GEZN01001066.1/.p1  ORF type:complete len:904 (+),score=100.10 gb/GEZN01001066.1/:202-2913(+)
MRTLILIVVVTAVRSQGFNSFQPGNRNFRNNLPQRVQCVRHSDCVFGSYCDNLRTCFSCDYVFQNRVCDAVDGDCHSLMFDKQCQSPIVGANQHNNSSSSNNNNNTNTISGGTENTKSRNRGRDTSENKNGRCSTHSDCAPGHYCDGNLRCFACAYLSIPRNLCDAYDGKKGCCTKEFGAQCMQDPKKCVPPPVSVAIPSNASNMAWIPMSGANGVLWNSLAALNAPNHDVMQYRSADFLMIRRGRSFKIQTSTNPIAQGALLRFGMSALDKSFQPIGNELVSFAFGGRNGYWFTLSSAVNDGSAVWEFGYADNGYLGPMQLSLTTCDSNGWNCQTSLSNFLLFVLADPNRPSDDAYMSNDIERLEYCGSEYGSLWLGSEDNMLVRRWTYDQFSANSIKVAAMLIGTLQPALRSSLVQLSRHMSSVVNSNNMDGGVVTGKWENSDKPEVDPYRDGTSPMDWTGTDQIYRDYLQKGVAKYGQCWVFAGVLTTVMRTYGVCARSITNYVSLHPNAPFNGNVRMYYSARGQYERTEGGSVWNFHAWTDAFFARDDGLPSGWQAIDATPQELSNGKMQLGPASQRSIQAHAWGTSYDVSFVVGEVSGGIERWGMVGGRYQLFESNVGGRSMSTQSPGTVGMRMDITSQYKISMEKMEVTRHEPTVAKYLNTAISLDGPIKAGEDIPVHLSLELVDNSKKGKDAGGKGALSVDVALWVRFTDYTGQNVHRELQYSLSSQLKGRNKKAALDFKVPAKDYFDELKQGYQYFEIQAVCTINENELNSDIEALPATMKSSVSLPDLQVSLLKLSTSLGTALRLGEELVWLLIFTNPLSVPMTELLLTTTLSDDEPDFLIPSLKLEGKLGPGETLQIAQKYEPGREGTLRLVVRLKSAELPMLIGDAFLEVVA